MGCIDPVLLDWFTYVPMVTKQRALEKKGTVIVVDATLADATSPLKTKEGMMSVTHKAPWIENVNGWENALLTTQWHFCFDSYHHAVLSSSGFPSYI